MFAAKDGIFIIKDLIINAGIMVSYYFIVSMLVKEPFRMDLNRKEQLKTSLSAAFLGIILMYFSIDVTVNARLDLRNLPIIIIAVFSGPFPALLAGGLIALARYLLHGMNEASFIAASCIVIFTLGAAAATRLGGIWRVWMVSILWSIICTSAFLYAVFWGEPIFWSSVGSYSLISIIGGASVCYLVQMLQRSAILIRENEQYAQQMRMQNELLEVQNEEILAQQDELEMMLAKIESQHSMIERILQYSSDGVILCNAKGHIHYSNEQVRQLGLGCAHWDNITVWLNSWQRLVQPANLKLRDHAEEVLTGKQDSYRTRFSIQLENGKQYVEMRLDTLSTGLAQKEFLLVFRNRSEEEKANEIKNEFISVVSHELRTPLSSVQGFIEIMLHRRLPEEKQKQYLQTVYNESLRLSHLIDDFLDIQRMEAGRQEYHFELLELRSVTEEIIEEWRQDEHVHRLNVQVSDDALPVLADKDKLKQVYLNLLSNAVKYSPGADRVDVQVSRDAEDVCVKFIDYGLGIPDEAKPNIFQPFYRVDNSDRRKIGGSGLGLTIVKKIVEAHGGRVTFDSVYGQGTTFSVTLPFSYSRADLHIDD